jgi:hypothetical protein
MDVDLSKITFDPTKPLADILSEHNPCSAGLEYSRNFSGDMKDVAAAWDLAPNPEILLWVLQQLCGADATVPREFMCWCLRHTPFGEGRTVWELLEDERSQRVVEVAERYLRREATDQDLRSARHDAQAAFMAIEEQSEWRPKSVRFAARAAPRVGIRSKVWDAAVLVVWDTVRAAAHAAMHDVPEDAPEDTWEGAFEKAHAAALLSQSDFLRARHGHPGRKLGFGG